MNHKLDINFKYINSIDRLLVKFNEVYNLAPWDKIDVDINIPDYVYPEYLAIVVTIIKDLKNKGIETNINVNNQNNTYVSRINFYKELGLEYEEDFVRHNSNGKFTEITNFNEQNDVQVVNNIIKIIKDNFKLEESIIKALNYTFFEIVGNVYQHSVSPIGGYTVAQNYNNAKELRAIVLDTGIGIHNSLIKNNIYANLTEEDALKYCIKESITSGSGAGNGLFHTTEFIRNNKGCLEIYSGNHCLIANEKKVYVKESPYWQGTLVRVRINNNPIDLSIFGDDLPPSISEFEDTLNGWF